jgi:hypothetical protein
MNVGFIPDTRPTNPAQGVLKQWPGTGEQGKQEA